MDNIQKTQAMEITSVLSKALLLLLALMMLANLASAKDTMYFKGKVSASGQDLNGALLVIELNGEQCMLTRLDTDGKFKFEVPVGSHVIVSVIKDGFISKDVLIDTDNAYSSKNSRKKNKTISFYVELLPRSFEGDLIYTAPVGIISFLRGSGLMKVQYDQQMADPNELASGHQ